MVITCDSDWCISHSNVSCYDGVGGFDDNDMTGCSFVDGIAVGFVIIVIMYCFTLDFEDKKGSRDDW